MVMVATREILAIRNARDAAIKFPDDLRAKVKPAGDELKAATEARDERRVPIARASGGVAAYAAGERRAGPRKKH